MSKRFFITLVCCSLSFSTYAQIAKDLLIGTNLDLIKTDNNGFLEKAQISLESNYFITQKFTATAGFDFWTGEGVSVIVGGRWYPVEEAFVRFRGLIGENDLSIGGGWAKPITENWRFEAIGDFYFSVDFAIRAGIIYVIRRKA